MSDFRIFPFIIDGERHQMKVTYWKTYKESLEYRFRYGQISHADFEREMAKELRDGADFYRRLGMLPEDYDDGVVVSVSKIPWQGLFR